MKMEKPDWFTQDARISDDVKFDETGTTEWFTQDARRSDGAEI
jgi:hypothetical protein